MRNVLRDHLRNLTNPSLLFHVVHLPPRRPRGDPRNVRRVWMMAAANHRWRVARMEDSKRIKHERQCQMCRTRIRWKWPT
jgi:hypothetical protein